MEKKATGLSKNQPRLRIQQQGGEKSNNGRRGETHDDEARKVKVEHHEIHLTWMVVE